MKLTPMTITQFEQQKFSAKTEIIYQNKTYKVLAVDFEECLIAIDEMGDGEHRWKRCENCAIKINVNVGFSGYPDTFFDKANESLDLIKIELEKKKQKENDKAMIVLVFLIVGGLFVAGVFFYSIIFR